MKGNAPAKISHHDVFWRETKKDTCRGGVSLVLTQEGPGLRNQTQVLNQEAGLFRGHYRLHFFLIDVEVGGDALNVVMLLERFDEPQHLRRLCAG